MKQRIALRLEIKPITPSEVRDYLKFRWQRCDSERQLPFSDEAIGAISAWSRGIPRLINTICDNALLMALGLDRMDIDAKMIHLVATELDLTRSPHVENPVRNAAVREIPLNGNNGVKKAIGENGVSHASITAMPSLRAQTNPLQTLERLGGSSRSGKNSGWAHWLRFGS